MLSRALRVFQRLPPCRTSLSQHLVRRLMSSEAADATNNPKGAPIRTAYIRSWRPAENITESWMMIREIEKRYGKVLETHFLKDFEDAGKYQMITFIVFADPKSLERIPESGIELTISSRPANKPTHEIGLEDVEHLVPSSSLISSALEEIKEVPAADLRNDSSVLGFRIQPANINYAPENVPRHYTYQLTTRRIMEDFEAWGGFANLAPLDPPRLMRVQELFAGPGTNEQKRMRAALDLCARNLQSIKRNSTPIVAPSSSPSIGSSPAANKKPQDIQEAPSTPPSKSAPVPNTPAPASVVQETVTPSPTPKTKSKPTLTAKPASQTQTATSKAVDSLAGKAPAPKPAATVKPSASVTPSSSQSSLQPSKKIAAHKTPKPTGLKLPPPVQQRPTANIPRRLPKPKIPASKSAPIRSVPTQSEKTESKNEEAAPTEAPGTLSRLWGLLTGKRG